MIEPNPTERGRPFWDGAADGELRVQVCTDCRQARLPAALRCGRCRSPHSTWEAIEPVGTVLAITTVRRPGHPALADAVPYRTSVVSLGESCHAPMLVAQDAPEDVAVGSRVAIGFLPVTDEQRIPVVRGHASPAHGGDEEG